MYQNSLFFPAERLCLLLEPRLDRFGRSQERPPAWKPATCGIIIDRDDLAILCPCYSILFHRLMFFGVVLHQLRQVCATVARGHIPWRLTVKDPGCCGAAVGTRAMALSGGSICSLRKSQILIHITLLLGMKEMSVLRRLFDRCLVKCISPVSFCGWLVKCGDEASECRGIG